MGKARERVETCRARWAGAQRVRRPKTTLRGGNEAVPSWVWEFRLCGDRSVGGRRVSMLLVA